MNPLSRRTVQDLFHSSLQSKKIFVSERRILAAPAYGGSQYFDSATYTVRPKIRTLKKAQPLLRPVQPCPEIGRVGEIIEPK